MRKVIINFLSVSPAIKRAYERNYLSAPIGVYLVSSIFKKIFLINNKTSILVNYTSRITHPTKVIIGKGPASNKVYGSFLISGNCYYAAANGIEIGEGTIWSFGCHFISANHSYTDLNESVEDAPIQIGRFVWLGSNSVILPGVRLGDYCIAGAGSIVTKTFPSYTIIAGNPAKPIANRCKNCLNKIVLGEEYCKSCRLL